ncbi:TonB-dependent receptor [bacterium]|nr:MAG: TonB-dependent receptor [bacterium]
MVKRIAVPILAYLLLMGIATCANAQGVGKLAGTVLDQGTGLGIPGANVIVQETTLGATTNIDGEFFVLNVPIGIYDLKVTTLGYATKYITGVEILGGETYEITVQLREEAIMGEEVVVTAERDVVKRDVTNTIRSMQSKEITDLPVTTYQEVLTKTAGVVGSGTNIHIRGGRRDEIMFMVDGLPVKDQQFQRRPLDVPKSAIAEMQVLTAGFDAQFGEAQSAIINVITHEGESEYSGHVEHLMDVDGVENYQDYDYTEASFSGPEPITNSVLPELGVRIPGSLSMFGSGTVWSRNANQFGTMIDTDRWFRHQVTNVFDTDVRKNETNTNSNLKLTYNSKKNYKVSFGWNQAQQWQNPYWYRMSRRFPDDFSLTEQTMGMHALSSIQGLSTNATDFPQYVLQDFDGNGSIDPSDIRMADDDGDGRYDEEALNWVDDDGDGLIDEDLQSYAFNANNSLRAETIRDQQIFMTLNHTLSANTYYTLSFSMYDASRTLSGGGKAANEQGLASETFTDMPNANGVYNGRYDVGEPFVDADGDGMYDYNNPANGTPNVNGFYIAGDGLGGNYQQLVPDWAHWESQTYTVKWDLSSQVHQRHLLRTGLDYAYYNVMAEDRPYPSIANLGEGIYTDIYSYHPSAGAAYIQDKMEYKDIIINAGVRVDYWRIGSNSIQNPVARDSTVSNFVDYEPPPEAGTAYLSPRLGVAYSVTDRDVFHFNYGYFYQRGRQDYYFTAVNQLQTGGTPIIGNPDLEPAKTIAYELGVRHQFAEDFLLDVSTYYKDVKNWIQTASQNNLYYDLYGYSPTRSNAAIYYNADYASIRGIEFNLSKDYAANFSGRLTYTLSWASGKNSYDIGSDVTRGNYIDPSRETPLAWDRRHQLVANLAFRYPLKGKPFSPEWLRTGWTMNILSQALSGLPYTPTHANGSDVTGQEFSLRSPWTYYTDVSLGRHFRFGNLNWQAMLEVRNLFDRMNVLGWDRNTYTIDTNQSADNPHAGEPGYVNDNTSPNYGQNPTAGPNPDAWDNPRQIRFGLAVDF